MRKWSELFPEGRWLYYEGDDPEGFANEMVSEFGFDPSECDGWAQTILNDEPEMCSMSYGFYCPASCIDQVYGGTYPLGS